MERVKNMPPRNMPTREEFEERVNNMPTQEEFVRLSDIRRKHQEVFRIVEEYRGINNNFRYAVRQRDNEHRLTYGWIFKGNNTYIEIGLSGCNDDVNMTRTIYLLVDLINDTVEFHVVCRRSRNETIEIYQERSQKYINICRELNLQLNQNYEIIGIMVSSVVGTLDNLRTTLTNWFNDNYEQLYDIMNRNDILISEHNFNRMINNQVNRGILVENNGQIIINENYQPNFISTENGITTYPADQDNEAAETEPPPPDNVVAHTQVTIIDKPHNLIYFGAPGTGKSYKLNEALDSFNGNFERVTFYPTYSYAQFVGTYKPVMVQDNTGNNNGNTGREEIAYQFVPGPFLRVLTNAKRHPGTNYCLVIEEINRANAAAVFGDVFQLLDRNSDGESEYSIAASEDIKKYLINQVKDIKDIQVETLSIPQNMYIWATMNSADQGVFPMDTAFKRRWSFEYIGIDDGVTDECECKGWVIEGPNINWNVFRKFVNGLLSSFDVNEDKLMGPYFVKADKKADNIDQISKKLFASKVLMYLWEDAARMIRKNIFGAEIKTYSQLVSEWKDKNIRIFDYCKSKLENNKELSDLYKIKNPPGDTKSTTQAEDAITANNGNVVNGISG